MVITSINVIDRPDLLRLPGTDRKGSGDEKLTTTTKGSKDKAPRVTKTRSSLLAIARFLSLVFQDNKKAAEKSVKLDPNKKEQSDRKVFKAGN